MTDILDPFGYGDELYHYGTPRHSGRYPWGSGDNPYQHASYFMKQVKDLRDSGKYKNDTEIAKALGMKTTEFRARIANSSAEIYASNVRQALKLHDKGMSNVAIGKVMGVPEGTIRNYLKADLEKRANKVEKTADILLETLNNSKSGMIDVSLGTERILGVTDTCLKNSLALLKDKGYTVTKVYIPQMTNKDQNTTIKVLAKKDLSPWDVNKNKLDVEPFVDYHSEDGGLSFNKVQPPKSIDSKRVKILYKDEKGPDGFVGEDRDGVIQIRRGVPDISLGDDLYAQVRIAVDGTHYMKGMAVYADDSAFPKGVDVIYNSNKPSGTDKYKVFKAMKTVKDEDGNDTIDMTNPFGAVIKADGQSYYTDSKGKKQLSLINKIRSEGDWGEYSKTLSPQFLSKQSKELIKKQLDLALKDKEAELADILAIENDGIKKSMLQSFADGCDKSSYDLKAAALPRQATQVIIADPNLKDTEIYAPNYKHGEYVALIRYPHAGTFEIPILKVNNNSKSSKDMLGQGKDTAQDAVCINKHVADKLSGADFDGDTVMVIPTHGKNGVKIIARESLPGLKDYDPKEMYPGYEGMKVIAHDYQQKQMGIVTNLITDMTIMGAPDDEIAAAVRHSMTIIDAEKHGLDYKASYNDNRIAQLNEKYRGSVNAGASTLISQAKSPVYVNARKEGVMVIDENGKKHLQYYDPKTGDKLYTELGKTKTTLPKKWKDEVQRIKDDDEMTDDQKRDSIRSIYENYGKTEDVQVTTTKMENTSDARTLISKYQTAQEIYYADYANSLKNLAREARLTLINTPDVKRDPNAAKDYKNEVESLKAKVDNAILNAPRERAAQVSANKALAEILRKDPNAYPTPKEMGKARSVLTANARAEKGAVGKNVRIVPTASEWEAINKHAVSQNLLSQVLKYMDDKTLASLALPKLDNKHLTQAQENRIKALNSSGYTNEEIADIIGASASTIRRFLKES